METDTLPQLSIDGPSATIRLCRPKEHNRIDPADVGMLMEYLQEVSADPRVLVLILTGSGDKTFSSGYTLQAIRDRLDDRFEKLLDHLETYQLPVICALNGSVYGGATDLALCCDFRIGVRGSRLVMPASKFGLHYYPGGIRRYVTHLGLAAAKKLFLTAQAVDADEMLRIGFLTELVDADALHQTVDQYVHAIVLNDATVITSMKRHLNLTAAGKIDIEAQRADYEKSLRSEELAKRISLSFK